MSTTSAADQLLEDFQNNGVKSSLGQLFLRIVVIRPIQHLYSEGDIESIKIKFTDGKVATVKAEEVEALRDAPDQRLEDRFGEEHDNPGS